MAARSKTPRAGMAPHSRAVGHGQDGRRDVAVIRSTIAAAWTVEKSHFRDHTVPLLEGFGLRTSVHLRTPIVVDRRQAAPLHRQIYEQWRTGILTGRFAAGDRMPSTRELAARAARLARHGRDRLRPADGRGLSRHPARVRHLRVPRSARHARRAVRRGQPAARRDGARRSACRRSPAGWRRWRGAAPPARASSTSPPTVPPSISSRSTSGSAWSAVTCRRSAQPVRIRVAPARATPALREMLAAVL